MIYKIIIKLYQRLNYMDGRGKPTYPVIATTHHEVRSLNIALLYTVRINSADDECCYYKTI